MVTPCSTVFVPFPLATWVSKLPTNPEAPTTSASHNTWMSGCFSTLSTSPARYSWTSFPFQVLVRSLAAPPRTDDLSTRVAGNPWSARLKAAVIPATPPPITRADLSIFTETAGIGSNKEALFTDIRTRSLDFSVAASLSSEWTQVHWFLMLAISNRYAFRPALRKVSWNSGSWVLGVHAATTIRFSFWSLITSTILS